MDPAYKCPYQRREAAPDLTGEVIDAFAFFVRGDSWMSRLIMRVSAWSHCGIGFTVRLEDGRLALPYFEALFGKGFRGPKRLHELHNWAANNPRRRVEVYHLGLEPAVALQKYALASAMVGTLGYAEWQLLAMWWFERFGRARGWHVPRSERRVVCSEALTRILLPEIDLRDAQHPREDEVTPGSARDALVEWLSARGQL
jgi:hypothetical protein